MHDAHRASLKKKAASEDAMNEGLAAIYGEERGDLATLERGGSRLTRWLIGAVVALAALAIASYAGFFVYMRFFASPVADPLILTIDMPADVVSGTAIDITVRYRNEGRVPLAALSLDLNLPDAFTPATFTSAPTDSAEFVWNIGSIAAHAEDTIVLHGVWLGSVPSTTLVQALATYRPANFNADFDAVASAAVTTSVSMLTTTVSGPNNVVSGADASYIVTIENTGDMPFADVQTKLLHGTGFVLSSSDPVLAPGDPAVWEFAVLEPHASQTITLHGSFASDTTDVQQLIARTGTTIPTAQGDAQFVQSEANVFTDVVGNGLSIQLVANGTNADLTLDPGDPLRLTVGYENTSEAAIADVSVLVDFRSEGKVPITWSEAALDGGRLTTDGIRFDASTIGTLTPHDKKIKNLIFPVRDELALGDAQSWSIVVHVTVGGVTIVTRPLTVTLNSDTAFSAAARYYNADGAPVGEGPLPPKVGETTTYQLDWTLSNALHALDDVRVSAVLPPGVDWTNTFTADLGAVSYDEGTRTIAWTVSGLPASTETVHATFALSVTPDDDDVGAFIKLLSGSAFRGTDTTTGSTIQLTADALTTECAGDAGVEGKGTVEE